MYIYHHRDGIKMRQFEKDLEQIYPSFCIKNFGCHTFKEFVDRFMIEFSLTNKMIQLLKNGFIPIRIEVSNVNTLDISYCSIDHIRNKYKLKDIKNIGIIDCSDIQNSHVSNIDQSYRELDRNNHKLDGNDPILYEGGDPLLMRHTSEPSLRITDGDGDGNVANIITDTSCLDMFNNDLNKQKRKRLDCINENKNENKKINKDADTVSIMNKDSNTKKKVQQYDKFEKIKCLCGSVVSRNYISAHLNTKKHIDYVTRMVRLDIKENAYT